MIAPLFPLHCSPAALATVTRNLHFTRSKEMSRNIHAFPLDSDQSVEGHTEWGMTLRDYFAAHAPAEPWPHFMPVMPALTLEPPREPIDNDGNVLRHREWTGSEPPPGIIQLRNLNDWRDDPHWDIDDSDEYKRFSNWCAAWRAYWTAKRAWDSQQWVERAEQWPWFYADTMLRRRGA